MTTKSGAGFSLKKIYEYRLRRYMKFLPIIGIIILFALTLAEDGSSSEIKDATPFSVKMKTLWSSFVDSFYWGGGLEVFTTLVILSTLWTGYYYWLKRLKFVRRNAKLLEKLVIFLMIFTFIGRHIKPNSIIGPFVDWALFLILLYLVIVGTWFLAKTIDGINLASDLYNWGLRLVGGIIIIFGFILFFSSSFYISFSNTNLVMENIYWILAVCLFLLGFFMQYRSFRRHAMLGIWHG